MSSPYKNLKGYYPHMGLTQSSSDIMGRNHPMHVQQQQNYQQARPSSSRYIKLLTNAYEINSNLGSRIVYEYQLVVVIAEGFRDVPPQVLSRNFVSKSLRKLVLEELVPRLTSSNRNRSCIVIEPNLNAIYSLEVFKLTDADLDSSQHMSSETEFRFNNLAVKTDLLTRLHVDVSIKFKRSISSSDLEENFTLLVSILHNKLLNDMIRYGSVYYESQEFRQREMRESRLDLISQHIMGISLSGIKRTTNNQNLVVINCPHSYITQAHRLIDLLASFIAGHPVEDIPLHCTSRQVHRVAEIESIIGNEEWFLSFCSILNGFKCTASGLDGRIKLRFNLTEESALNLRSTESETVQEYFSSKHGIELTYPNLPCLRSKTDLYPLEICSVVPNQKVPIFRLSTSARLHLATLNKPKPDLSKSLSASARDKVVTISSDVFEKFGLNLSRDPTETKGFTLARPTLKFDNRDFEPRQDYWESGRFYHAMNLTGNWCIVNTVDIDLQREEAFFSEFSGYCKKFGFLINRPHIINRQKRDLIDQVNALEFLIEECQRLTLGNLRFIMFIIDSSSTSLNRLIHLAFDEHPIVTATCLRLESIMNYRQQRSIFRTLVHKLNARLGGCNVTFHRQTLAKLNLSSDELMIVGLDVTHPDNELSGVSIVGCAYTYSTDLFKHRSLVWPQAARLEIISKMDQLVRQILMEYYHENQRRLPKQLIIYRDGVSHEEFDRVRNVEVQKAQKVLEEAGKETCLPQPNLSYIIAQKRHTMRFFHKDISDNITNPPSGTLVNQDVVSHGTREFYLYSNTSPQATARPLHYHVLLNGLGIENLQELTYMLCFNFGKCSGTLSMPSSLKYAHNAAYDARNRVINAREFSENRFYSSKFFC